MPKLTCPCGFVHNLSPIPDDGWITVRDSEYEALIQDEIAYRSNGDNKALRRLSTYTGRYYKCPRCGRIMMSAAGDRASNFTTYGPEA